MKNRGLGILLILCLCIGLLPMPAAMAADYGIQVGGVQVTDENASDVLGDGTVSYDAAENTLTLNGANITTAGSLAGSFVEAAISSTGALNIVLAEGSENHIALSSVSDAIYLAGIFAGDGAEYQDLTISGGGKLSIDLRDSSGYTAYGIGGNLVTISGGADVAVTLSNMEGLYMATGVVGYNTVLIDNATVAATVDVAASANNTVGIASSTGNVGINNANVTASAYGGIMSTLASVSITGASTVNATGTTYAIVANADGQITLDAALTAQGRADAASGELSALTVGSNEDYSYYVLASDNTIAAHYVEIASPHSHDGVTYDKELTADSSGNLLSNGVNTYNSTWQYYYLDSGSYYLGGSSDVLAVGGSFNRPIYTRPNSTVNLCLNGKTLSPSTSMNVDDGGTLTVTDCGEGGKISKSGQVIAVDVDGTLILNGGQIESTSGGTAIWNRNTAVINGGTVTGTIDSYYTIDYEDTNETLREREAPVTLTGSPVIGGGETEDLLFNFSIYSYEDFSEYAVLLDATGYTGGNLRLNFARNIEDAAGLAAIRVSDGSADKFTLVNEGYQLVRDGNYLVVRDAASHSHDGVSFDTEWSGSMEETTITQNTNIVLTGNVTIPSGSNIAISNGAVVNLCLNGKDLYLATSGGKSSITVEAGATLNLYDCQNSGRIYSRNTNSADGTVINNGTVNLYGGTVENVSSGAWSAIRNEADGTLNISGGTVDGGSATCAFYNRGTANLTGGTVTMADTDSALSNTYGELTIGGDAVISNTGAGPALTSRSNTSGDTTTHITGGSLTASSNAAVQIAGTNVSSYEHNVYLSGAPAISGGEGKAAIYMGTTSTGVLAAKLYATATADSGSTPYSGGALALSIDEIRSDTVGQTVVFGSTDTDTFTLLDAGDAYFLTASNGNLTLAKQHSHSLCGGTDCGHEGHENLIYTALDDGLASGGLKSRNYYLTEDITEVNTSIEITGTVNLCLNGHTISGDASNGIFQIGENGVLNVCDCQGGGVMTEIGEAGAHNPVLLHSGGTLNLYSGTISSRITAVVIDELDGNVTGGTVNVYGGTVSSSGINSQAIKINANLTNAAVNISGGEVTAANRAILAEGGSIYLSGSPTISGGESKADIYMSTTSAGELAAKLYATATAESSSTPYSGEPLALSIKDIDSDVSGEVVVANTADATKFTLIGAGDDYLLAGSNGNLVLHVHSWSTSWKSTSTAHWHECTASGCPITDDTQKYGYAAHSAPADDGNCTTAVTCATCGYEFKAAQTHSYTYSASGNIISETCSNEGCTHSETATISTPDGTLTYDGTTAFNARVTYSDGWAGGKDLAISYTKGGEPVTDTKGAGSYTASITVDEKIVQVSYTVNKAGVDVPTILSKEYTGSNQTANISDTTFYTVTQNAGGTNVGDYDVVLELSDSDNYKWKSESGETDKITLTFSITADTNEWTTTPDIAGWTYGETAKEPTGAAKYGTVMFTYYDSEKALLSQKPADAGDYYMKATVAADGNNYAEIQTDYIPFTIQPKEIVIEWAEDDFTYSGTDQKAKVTASYKDILGNSVRLTTSTTGEFMDYNEEGYTFTASFANGETNYKLPDEITKTYHMKKATPVVTFPTAGEITYGDTLAASALSGETGDGTFAWASETTIPPVTNSGYEMIFTPNDTNNYDYTNVEGYQGDTKTVTCVVTITVKPRPVNISWTGTENLVYDGKPKTISAQVANLVGGGVVNLSMDGTVSATEKGEYTASVTSLDNENYTIVDGQNLTKQWAIAEGTNEFTTPLSITGWTYGQTPNTPTVEAKFGIPVFTYSDEENGAYSDTVPTEAGDYWVKATVLGTVNYAEISTTAPFKISKAQPTVPETPAPAAVTYNALATLADITLPDGWVWADSTIIPFVQNEGYTAYYAVDDGNYNWTGADGYDTENHRLERTIALTVNPAKPTYTAPDNLTAVYGQTLADVTLPTGFTWQDATATSVGNYGNNRFLVTYWPADTSNYQTVTDIEVTIAVTQAIPVVILNAQNPQGMGENRSVDLVASVTGVNGGEIPVGTVEYFAGTESLGSATLTDGTAIFTWNNIPVGDHSLRAVYSGSTNYTTAEGTTYYNLDKEAQEQLVIGGVPETITYGNEPFALSVTGGSGTGALSYAITSGDSVSVDADGNVTILKAGESVITVTKAADEDYNETARKVKITVSQAVPVLPEGVEVTAQRVRRGNLLSTSEISGVINGIDGQPLEGTWTWKNDREMDETGTFEEIVVFTPTDTNYAPFETTVSVTVYRPSSGVTRYTVTFDSQGGSKIDSVRVNRNATVSEPAEPTREGYTFEGWFTDKDCTEAYDFSTKVTKSITLYAKWAEEQPTEPTDPDEPTEPDEPTDPDDPENPTEWENPYSDVAESDWFYDAVKYADENGLFSGVSATEFAPDGTLTRGMLVTVLWRAEEEPMANYLVPFEDVKQEAYYGEAVRWAASEGIVKGYSETEFAPDKLISREEMAAIMNRYADYKGVDTSESGDLTQFTDETQIADWARGNVAWAVGYGLILGRENNTLDPKEHTTRAETAAILNRFLEKNK